MCFFIFLLSLRIHAGVAWIYFFQQKNFTDIPHAIARHSQTRQQTILTFNPLVVALIINQWLNVDLNMDCDRCGKRLTDYKLNLFLYT